MDGAGRGKLGGGKVKVKRWKCKVGEGSGPRCGETVAQPNNACG